MRAQAQLELVRRTQSSLPLLEYIPALSEDFSPPYHLAALTERLDLLDERPQQVVVAVPPRHAKTETMLHCAARFLHRYPHKTVGYATYSANFARSKSLRLRGLAQKAGVILSDDSQRAEEWRTEQWGGCLATGVGGPLTGHGVHLMIVDDPFKNRVEAESPLWRERVWDWFNDVVYTRIEPGGSIVVTHTRWHQDDLAGRLIDDGWDHVHLPALTDDGVALWPERYPVERLLQIREQVGQYSWASLYQGQPVPKGGALFDGVTTYDELPSDGYTTAVGIDLAYTAKTRADHSVLLVGRAVGEVIYIERMIRAQVSATAFRQHIAHVRAEFPYAKIMFIRGGQERAIVEMFNETGLNIQEKPAVGDKMSRALGAAAAWSSGKIRVPKDAPWVDTFLGEILSFTGAGDATDDIVDALVALYDAVYGQPFFIV